MDESGKYYLKYEQKRENNNEAQKTEKKIQLSLIRAHNNSTLILKHKPSYPQGQSRGTAT